MTAGRPFLKPFFYSALALCLLGALPRLCPPVMAQEESQANPFDYTPEGTAAPAEQAARPKQVTDIDLNEIEVIKDPKYGTSYRAKNAWKNWAERATELALLNLGVIALLFFMPKTEEHNLIICYFMTGVSFVLAIWVLFCGVAFITLKTDLWMYAVPASAVLTALTWMALARIKKADVSMTEIKSAFARTTEGGSDDRRLSAVDGKPGNWPEQDFLK